MNEWQQVGGRLFLCRGQWMLLFWVFFLVVF